MNLTLSTIVGPGRRPHPLTAEVVREINEADLGLLAVNAFAPAPPQELKRLSDRHHMAARLLAAAKPPGEVAMITGYSASRLSVIQQSPAFKELVSLYKREVDIEFGSVLETLAGLSKEALSEISDRLEEEPEQFSLKDLRETAAMGLNRTGFPEAKSLETNLNVNFGTRLEAARKRAHAAARGEIIDAEVVNENDD